MRRKLKYKLISLIQRMRRMPRTRGFGVQSPTAYSILRHVLNERGFLRKNRLASSQAYPFHAPRQERLIWRIRFSYSDTVVTPAVEILASDVCEVLLSSMSANSVLVIPGIDRGEEEKKLWNRILADHRTVLSYDLLNCGVVFFDNTKAKQNFKVNY